VVVELGCDARRGISLARRAAWSAVRSIIRSLARTMPPLATNHFAFHPRSSRSGSACKPLSQRDICPRLRPRGPVLFQGIKRIWQKNEREKNKRRDSVLQYFLCPRLRLLVPTFVVLGVLLCLRFVQFLVITNDTFQGADLE